MNANVKFKIIEVDSTQHSMVVRYFSDLVTEDDLATSFIPDENGINVIERRPDGSPVRCQTDYNINIWQTPAPDAEGIRKIASDSAPYDWFKIKHAIIQNTTDVSMSNVAALMNQTFEAIPSSMLNQLSDSEIQNLLNELSANT